MCGGRPADAAARSAAQPCRAPAQAASTADKGSPARCNRSLLRRLAHLLFLLGAAAAVVSGAAALASGATAAAAAAGDAWVCGSDAWGGAADGDGPCVEGAWGSAVGSAAAAAAAGTGARLSGVCLQACEAEHSGHNLLCCACLPPSPFKACCISRVSTTPTALPLLLLLTVSKAFTTHSDITASTTSTITTHAASSLCSIITVISTLLHARPLFCRISPRHPTSRSPQQQLGCDLLQEHPASPHHTPQAAPAQAPHARCDLSTRNWQPAARSDHWGGRGGVLARVPCDVLTLLSRQPQLRPTSVVLPDNTIGTPHCAFAPHTTCTAPVASAAPAVCLQTALFSTRGCCS
eukprot:scaffold40235_cov17-Tisochrysis_lutea.AAC.2